MLGNVCKNAVSLVAICDVELRTKGRCAGRDCDLGSCVAKTLRFCVCIWKAIWVLQKRAEISRQAESREVKVEHVAIAPSVAV